MPPIEDHPLRYKMANELHARPFPSMEASCFGAYVAIKQPNDAVARDRQKDMDHLLALLDRHGAPHPAVLGQGGEHDDKHLRRCARAIRRMGRRH